MPAKRGAGGIVFDIQRFSVHDGPGIRTTVFLKGCNIRCLWCHNPESFSVQPQLSYSGEGCTGCGACVAACSHGVHHLAPGGTHTLHTQVCTACGACAAACPAGLLKIFGREMAPEQVLDEVRKDAKYYAASGGGVTFSGGEPTVQFDFLLSCLRQCREEGIHTCLESNGILPPARLERLLPYLDLVLLDYKATGEALHTRLTGQSNHCVTDTLAALGRAGVPVILRCPIVQGLNDAPAHFARIRSLRREYPNIQAVEVMAYHALGRHKWDALGLSYTLTNLADASEQQKEQWRQWVALPE